MNPRNSTLLVWTFFLLFCSHLPASGQTIQLSTSGATPHHYENPDFTTVFAEAWGFSDSQIDGDDGRIDHQACLISEYTFLGSCIANYTVLDGMQSTDFQVESSGQYRLHITGEVDYRVMEGYSYSTTQFDKSAGELTISGGLTTEEDRDVSLYETNWSMAKFFEETSWSALKIVIDRHVDGSGSVTDVLQTIKDSVFPQEESARVPFSLYSTGNLTAGLDYRWSFYIASNLASASVGFQNNLEPHRQMIYYLADVHDLQIELEYLDGPVPEFQVSTHSGPNGNIWPEGEMIVSQGEGVLLEASSFPGYEVEFWHLDGSVVQIGGSHYSLSNVEDAHSVSVTFRPDPELTNIQMILPNGGEEFQQGKTTNVTWTWNGSFGDMVKVELLKGGLPVETLASQVDQSTFHFGDAFLRWEIPESLPIGSDYRIRVSSLDGSVIGASEGDFAVQERGDYIEVIEISTVAQLKRICTDAAYSEKKHYILMNDLDLSDEDNWRPIGYDHLHYLSGSFNGQGHTVRGLSIDRPTEDFIGLFSYLDSGGVIENLNLEIDRILGDRMVGGIAGENYGTIRNCHVTLVYLLANSGTCGGIAGNIYQGEILNCSVSATTRGIRSNQDSADEFGGIAGENDRGLISGCWVTAVVDADYVGDGDTVGGIVGLNSGTVKECWVVGSTLEARYKVGGLVGAQVLSGSLADCHFDGNILKVDGNSGGGLVGENSSGIVERCYVNGGPFQVDDLEGALVGLNYSDINHSFWNRDVVGIDQAVGSDNGVVSNCFGKSTAEMKLVATFTTEHSAGWDFASTWAIDEGAGFPVLRAVGASLDSPSGLTASNDEHDGVHLSWTAVMCEAYGPVANLFDPVYKIHRSDTPDVDAIMVEVSDWTPSTLIIDSSAIPGVQYFYWVRAAAANSGARESRASGYAVGQRTVPPVGIPKGVSASEGFEGHVLIQWRTVQGAGAYRLFRSEDENSEKVEIGNWQPFMSIVDTPPYSDTQYFYWVQAALNEEGDLASALSDPVTGSYSGEANVPVYVGRFIHAHSVAGVELSWEIRSESDPGDVRLLCRSEGGSREVPVEAKGGGRYSALDSNKDLLLGGRFEYSVLGSPSGVSQTVYSNVLDLQPIQLVERFHPNVPNPFNPSTKIVFELSRRQDAQVAVYDLRGRQVAVLADAVFGPGQHAVDWNGQDAQQKNMPSGVYFVLLRTESGVRSQKIALSK